MAQERDIKYINREFSDFKDQLVEYAKNSTHADATDHQYYS